MTRWIAADWGTSALRLTLVEEDRARETRSSGDGMNALDPGGFEAALLALAGDWIAASTQGVPMQVFACGMVGARQGWVEAPYRPVPCAPLNGGLTRVATRDARLDMRIVPGLSQRVPHADVMRGEETQIAGILRAIPDFDGIVCLPGTHTKWAHVSAREVVSFRTVMTGEVFALLSGQSVLRHSVGGAGWREEPFLNAVSTTLSRPETLTSRLFELRAEDLLEGRDAATARSVLSGLLIGAELSATRAWWLGRDIVVTGSDETMRAHASALRAQGLAPRLMAANEMTLAGLTAAREAATRETANKATGARETGTGENGTGENGTGENGTGETDTKQTGPGNRT